MLMGVVIELFIRSLALKCDVRTLTFLINGEALIRGEGGNIFKI